MGQTWKESRGRKETRTNAGVHGGRGVVEMVREPGRMEVRGTADSPVLPVREARAVETVVLGRVIPGGGRVWSGDKQVLEIWPVRRRDELDNE